MRDMVSCFSENSVNVSNPINSYSCKSYSKNACIVPNNNSAPNSTQNAVVSVYRVVLSTGRPHHVTVTWCGHGHGHGLSVEFGSDPNSTLRLTTSSRIFRRKKGSRTIDSEDSKVEAFWDLTSAKFGPGPEPLDGYYVVIVVDSEVAVVLGDLSEKKFPVAGAPARLVSRREHCSGESVYSSRARFSEFGDTHDLVVRSEVGDSGTPMLSVSIDKKVVIRVKRLRWNFRGNQTIFVDGLLVDLMWDVHNWFFNPVQTGSGFGIDPVRSGSSAVFMFRTRSGMDSRLWLEEKLLQKDEDRIDFSLLIYATRRSS